MTLDPPRAAALTLALSLLASAATAQPAPPKPAPEGGRALGPAAEDVAAADANSLRLERERALQRVEAALGATSREADGDAAPLERLRTSPGAGPADPTKGLSLAVHLHGCAPGAPSPGRVRHYGYRVEDDCAGVSTAEPVLVRGHLFLEPGGLLIRELPPLGPLGSWQGPRSGSDR